VPPVEYAGGKRSTRAIAVSPDTLQTV